MNDEQIKPTQASGLLTSRPPGIHRPSGVQSAEDRIRTLEAVVAELRVREASAAKQFHRVRELEVQLRLAQKKVEAAEERAQRYHAHIGAMERSSSWRFSSPIRAGGLALIKLKGGKTIARGIAKRVVLHGAAYARSRPALREGIATFLARFPGLRARMIQLAGYNAVQGFAAGATLPAVQTVDRLTARGRKVHADLLAARITSVK